jgi:hypothetical protein
MDEDEPSEVGERSMGRPREEDEQSRGAAFFRKRTYVELVMGRCLRSAEARGSGAEVAVVRLVRSWRVGGLGVKNVTYGWNNEGRVNQVTWLAARSAKWGHLLRKRRFQLLD